MIIYTQVHLINSFHKVLFTYEAYLEFCFNAPNGFLFWRMWMGFSTSLFFLICIVGNSLVLLKRVNWYWSLYVSGFNNVLRSDWNSLYFIVMVLFVAFYVCFFFFNVLCGLFYWGWAEAFLQILMFIKIYSMQIIFHQNLIF